MSFILALRAHKLGRRFGALTFFFEEKLSFLDVILLFFYLVILLIFGVRFGQQTRLDIRLSHWRVRRVKFRSNF